MSDVAVLKDHYLKSDKVMLIIVYGLIVYGLVLANWYDTWAEALIIGSITGVVLTTICRIAPGSIVSRVSLSAGLMVLTALHIQQSHGMIEMHFGIFVLLGVLLYYRDWLPILVAAVVTALHHLVFFYLQTQGTSVWLFGTVDSGWWIVFMHAGYVIAESSLFIWLSLSLRREAIQSTELTQLTNAIITGQYLDLTLRSSGATPLLQRFDGFTTEIQLLAQEVCSTAVALDRDGKELSKITQAMKDGASIQRRETDMIAQAIEEMSMAMAGVTRNAKDAATSVGEVGENISQATSVSRNTESAVNQLAESIDQAVETIKDLNEQTKNIGSVLDVIRGVAEQTNLLALNAAIEAARAGEQGRGFAVVADEVRTLAQRTQQSTQEIDKMIEALQISSESAVKSIENSRRHADHTVENTQGSVELMELVTQAVGEINGMNTAIASVCSEQENVINEISKNISNILLASNEAVDDSAKAADSGLLLVKISTALQGQVERFKIS
jgi:methyl-accepting chemotaxis protein